MGKDVGMNARRKFIQKHTMHCFRRRLKNRRITVTKFKSKRYGKHYLLEFKKLEGREIKYQQLLLTREAMLSILVMVADMEGLEKEDTLVWEG